jgi:hypothetical protein
VAIVSSVLSNPFGVEEHVLVTQLGPSMCRARLDDALMTWDNVDRWSPLNPNKRDPVVGQVSAHGFNIRKWWRYKRPYDLDVWGEFQPAPGGTRVHVYIAMRRKIAAFFLFWFVFMLMLQAALALGFVATPGESLTPLGAWVPGLAALAGGVAYLLGRAAAKRDALFLLDFLREVLQAKEGSSDNPRGEYSRP